MSRSVTCCDMFVTRCVMSPCHRVWAIHTRGRGGHQAWAWANEKPVMGRVANQRPQHEVTCRIFWWHPQPFTSPAEHKKIHTISPEEADRGEIIEPLMIFVNFHEAFMAILKDSTAERNCLLGKKLVKSTIITQHHLQRDRILWKCTWEASINNIIPTFTRLEKSSILKRESQN